MRMQEVGSGAAPLPASSQPPRRRSNRLLFRVAAAADAKSLIPDATIRVKLMLAESSGRLDLSECGLREIPPQVFDLVELEELSLAGNEIASLPPEIGQLKCLQRLQLSGNHLRELPDSFGELQQLEGLWAHGNRLTELPATIGSLSNLVQLSVAGNELSSLPPSMGGMKKLKELVAAGNNLRSLPDELEGLTALEILTLHGNQLESVPSSLAGLSSLRELWLQGNPGLAHLPSELGSLAALQHFSAADCALEKVPSALGAAPALRTLTLYGNRLRALSAAILEAPSLTGLWAEGNAQLDSQAVEALLHGAAATEGRLTTLGLDARQLAHVSPELVAAAGAALKMSEIVGEGPGYFKLERGPAGKQIGAASVLVVAFGSAPGVPNWGGALKRVRGAAAEPAHDDFDVLYVVDPYRRWYEGGGEDPEFEQYASRLATVTSRYRHVVMIGDSMGATAALMFAGLATSVHAFCPQVDLASSSIRPGKGAEWGAALRRRVLEGAAACPGRVTVHVGDWKHDLDQANLLPKDDVHVQIYSVPSHRLAIVLDRTKRLVPTLQQAILNEMGISANNVRIANLY